MKKNFIYNIIYQILILILPLITVPYVSRILGAEGIGIYSYTYSIAYYFMIIAMLGLNNYGNRAIAKVRDNKEKLSKEFCSIYVFQIITSGIMIIAYLLYVLIFNIQYKIIAIIQIIYIISSTIDINWFFFGIEKFKLTITRNIIIKLLALILVFVFVKTSDDIWKYTIILAGSTLVSNLVLITFLRKYINIVKISKKDIIKHLKPNLILFLPVIAVSIYKIMDKIMLGILSSVTEVGYYENAEKITQVPVGIITALGTVMMPRVTNMLSNQQEDIVKNVLNKTIPFAMFMTFPMVFGLIAVSNDFSVLFFGNEFQKCVLLIQLLSITIIFLAWGNIIRMEYLIPKEKDKEYVMSAFIGAVVNFIMNCIFIPKYASMGACIGTIVAEFFVMFYQSWTIRHELPLKEYVKSSIGFFVKAVIMFVIVIIVGNFIEEDKLKRMIIQILIGIFAYGILNIKYILNNLPIKQSISKVKEA